MSEGNNYKVSLIIPIFNNGRDLYDVLNSVKIQTYRISETLVINDGSTNGINFEVQKLFPEFDLINLDRNYGVSYARNYGAKIAKGEILFFVDSDVILEHDTVARMLGLFKDQAVNIVEAVVKSEPNRSPISNILMSNLYNYTFMELNRKFTYTLNSFCFAVRKDIFSKLGFFNEDYKLPGGEEFDFSHKIIQNGYCIHFDKDITIRHLFKGFSKVTVNFFKRIPLTVNILLFEPKLKKVKIVGEKNHFIYLSSLFLFFALSLFIISIGFNHKSLGSLSILFFLFSNVASFNFYKYLLKNYNLGMFIKLLILYYFWLIVIFISVIKGVLLYFKTK